MSKLSHFNPHGEAHIVDVSAKSPSERIAVAAGEICMRKETLDAITQQQHQKGDVLGVARIAGIMAAKQTSTLIPLCHPLAISSIEITYDTDHENSKVVCTCTVKTTDRTGVEMEALTAIQVALLCIYDMCKAVDREMLIGNVRLLKKSGGRSGDWTRSTT